MKHNILLADDDPDDRLLFKEALEDLEVASALKTVEDGVELMQLLSDNSYTLPDILFLDLNMPVKNGFECLSEIKQIDRLKDIIVIIYSTSLDIVVVNLLYDKGAHYYIRKPAEYSKLREVISEVLTIVTSKKPVQPAIENFILHQ